MTPQIDKAAVFDALLAHITEALEAVTESQHKTVAGATHEEAKSESDKDTRATESSYLARGLAQRVSQLREAATRMAGLRLREFGEQDPAALSALVELEDEQGAISRYFIAPAGGGIKLQVAGAAIAVVTPRSPLGTALMGKRLDDDVEFRTPQGNRTLTLISLD